MQNLLIVSRVSKILYSKFNFDSKHRSSVMMFNYNTLRRVAALLIAHAGLRLLGAYVRAQDVYVPPIKCWTVLLLDIRCQR